MKYFSYSPNLGFELHETAEKARKYAQEDLDWMRHDAGDGWSEEVEHLCWGEVNQMAMQQEPIPVAEDDDQDFDFYIDYKLEDVSEINTDLKELAKIAPCTCPDADTGLGMLPNHEDANPNCYFNRMQQLVKE